jgi:hypothetical protein
LTGYEHDYDCDSEEGSDMSMVGKLTAKTVLGARANKLSWPYLWQSVVIARNEFIRLTMEESEETSAVRHKDQSIVQMYVHLAMEMREVAERLEGIRKGSPSQKPMADAFGGGSKLTFQDARLEYMSCWSELEEAAARPVTGDKTSPHEYFGALTAGQLLALVGYRHEQFAKQVEQIHHSAEYSVAKSADWRVAGARDEAKK